jgi:hypothetical protein
LELVRSIVTTLGVVALLALPASAAAAPSNDNWQSAQSHPLNVLFGQNTTDATLQGGEFIQCGDSSQPALSHSVWYRIPGTGGPIVFSTVGSDFDTIVGLYKDADPTVLANNIACNDDETPGTNTWSKIVFNTVKGANYLIQIGGCDSSIPPNAACGSANPYGSIQDIALANDFRAYPEDLTAPTVTRANVAASTEVGETTTCGGTSYGGTVWFHYKATAVGKAVFSSSRFTNALAVFQGNTPTPIGCAVGNSGPSPSGPRLSVDLTPGDYYVQVGTFVGQGTDVFNLQTEFTENLDRDGDGDQNATDCQPDNKAVHHGAVDVPGNGIDEDCVGGDAVPDRDTDGIPDATDKCPDSNATGRDTNRDGCLDPLQFSTGSADAKLRAVLGLRGGIKVELLSVKAPSGAKVVVKLGSRTVFDSTKKTTTKKRKKKRRTGRPSSLTRMVFGPNARVAKTFTVTALRNKRLSNGSKLKIWITRSGYVGAYIEYRISGGKSHRVDRCLPAGSLKPKTTCS